MLVHGINNSLGHHIGVCSLNCDTINTDMHYVSVNMVTGTLSLLLANQMDDCSDEHTTVACVGRLHFACLMWYHYSPQKPQAQVTWKSYEVLEGNKCNSDSCHSTSPYKVTGRLIPF